MNPQPTVTPTTTNPRRAVTIAAATLTLLLSPFCLFYYWIKGVYEYDSMYFFLGVSSLSLIAMITVLIAGKNRWRWAMLLLGLPCAFTFVERVFELMLWLRIIVPSH